MPGAIWALLQKQPNSRNQEAVLVSTMQDLLWGRTLRMEPQRWSRWGSRGRSFPPAELGNNVDKFEGVEGS